MIKIKHDDFCPCARLHTQPEFCTCGATSCEEDINAGIDRFGNRLRKINRSALAAKEQQP